MKDFSNWGIKRRIFPELNYNAIWKDLKTVRLGIGKADALPPEYSEFYDIGITTRCNAGTLVTRLDPTTGQYQPILNDKGKKQKHGRACSFCYVNATDKGEDYEDICETWKKWMAMDIYKDEVKDGITYTNRCLQVAIGSTGEATIHPQFCELLETIYNTGVVPNYTTNGISLAIEDEYTEKLLDYTSKYVGGVAVSLGNTSLKKHAQRAITLLLDKGNTNVNLHHIISDNRSVDLFVKAWKTYGSDILYHVLLPMMPAGRSTQGVQPGTFEYLEDKIEELDIKNVAFGAHFIDTLKNSRIPTWIYEAESFSKNIILTKDKVQITPSSFDLNPIKVFEF